MPSKEGLPKGWKGRLRRESSQQESRSRMAAGQHATAQWSSLWHHPGACWKCKFWCFTLDLLESGTGAEALQSVFLPALQVILVHSEI